jgi:hypothetical protein
VHNADAASTLQVLDDGNLFLDFSASCRMSLMRLAWSFQSPWEKFSRAASMPARMSLAIMAGELDAGPMVAMILVRLGMRPPGDVFWMVL